MINFDFNSDLVRLNGIVAPVLQNGLNKIYTGNTIDTTQMVACNINFILTKSTLVIIYTNFSIVSFDVLESDSISGVFTAVDDNRITGDIKDIRQLSLSGQNVQSIYKIGVFGTKKYIKVNFVYNYSGTTFNTVVPYINYNYLPRESK